MLPIRPAIASFRRRDLIPKSEKLRPRTALAKANGQIQAKNNHPIPNAIPTMAHTSRPLAGDSGLPPSSFDRLDMVCVQRSLRRQCPKLVAGIACFSKPGPAQNAFKMCPPPASK
jgi:hypothetical protein